MNEINKNGLPTGCGFPRPVRVRRSRSATLYMMVLDARGRRGGCPCRSVRELEADGLGPDGGRDRRYGFPKRYGLRTLSSTRRVDRIDPARSLY